jgi:putative methionine-R-sulfoxide reductase with GAF domain
VAVAAEAEFDDRWARHTLQRLCEILTGFHRDQLMQPMSQKRMPLSRYLQTVVFSQWKFWVAEEAHREKVRALTIWHLLHRRYQVNSKMIQGKVIKDWQNMTNFARIAEAQEALQEMWSMDQRLDGMFKGLMLDAREILHADRSTLFLVDAEENVLLSKIALGTGEPIQVAIGQGIVGSVARSGQMLNITNAREDARFNSAIDKMTGYTTRSILCAPVISEGVIIGVLQVINKLGGTFTKHDEVMIEAFCAHIGTTALLVDCESDFSKILISLDTWRRDYLLVRGQHKHLAKLMTWVETRHMRGTMRRALHKMRRTCTWLAAEARAGKAQEMEGNAHLKLSDMAHGLRKNHTVCLSSALARWRGNMEMSDVLEQFQGIEATLRLQTLGRNLGKARSLCLARALRRWGLHCEADRAEERLEKLVHSSQTVADLRRQLADAEKAIEGVRRRDAELAAAADHELETLEGALRRERDLVSTAEGDRAHDREALEAARKRERELVAAAENDRDALEAARKRERDLTSEAEDNQEALEAARKRERDRASAAGNDQEALEAARKRERELVAAAEDDRDALEAARKRERDLASAAEDDQEVLEAARKRERELVAAAEDDRDALEAARKRERELVRAAEDGRQALEAAQKRERELVAAAEDDREALEVARKRERELVGAAEGTHGELEKARRREAELVAAEENRGPEGASLEEVCTRGLRKVLNVQ